MGEYQESAEAPSDIPSRTIDRRTLDPSGWIDPNFDLEQARAAATNRRYAVRSNGRVKVPPRNSGTAFIQA